MDMSLSELWELVMDREAQRAAIHVVAKDTTEWLNWTELKEQYFIGTWNIRSMKQDKLDVVKQEMARVNIDMVGISELKWTGMGDFNSDDH